ncbi:MAG: hypothetical protein AB7U92_22860 [Piscinibacter sp.]|uniref:hypothetical protein n=1 Tax=Piscinibacter sp. TaxID=1903157 RepID=UPI003D14C428
MRAVLRLLLLCLMALALPLQGLAATGAVHCAAMHDRMQVNTAHHHEEGAAAHHDEHAAASLQVSADEHPADDGTPRTGGAFKCSACAACCAALGLPMGAVTLPQVPAEALAPAIPQRAVAAFLTGGPERPPRTVLA